MSRLGPIVMGQSRPRVKILGAGALWSHAQLVGMAARDFDKGVIPTAEERIQNQENFRQKRKLLWGYRQYLYQIADALESYGVGETPILANILLEESGPTMPAGEGYLLGEYIEELNSIKLFMPYKDMNAFLERPARFPKYMSTLVHEASHALFNRRFSEYGGKNIDPDIADSKFLLSEFIGHELDGIYSSLTKERSWSDTIPRHLVRSENVETYVYWKALPLIDSYGFIKHEPGSMRSGLSSAFLRDALRTLSQRGTIGAQYFFSLKSRWNEWGSLLLTSLNSP